MRHEHLRPRDTGEGRGAAIPGRRRPLHGCRACGQHRQNRARGAFRGAVALAHPRGAPSLTSLVTVLNTSVQALVCTTPPHRAPTRSVKYPTTKRDTHSRRNFRLGRWPASLTKRWRTSLRGASESTILPRCGGRARCAHHAHRSLPDHLGCSPERRTRRGGNRCYPVPPKLDWWVGRSPAGGGTVGRPPLSFVTFVVERGDVP